MLWEHFAWFISTCLFTGKQQNHTITFLSWVLSSRMAISPSTVHESSLNGLIRMKMLKLTAFTLTRSQPIWTWNISNWWVRHYHHHHQNSTWGNIFWKLHLPFNTLLFSHWQQQLQWQLHLEQSHQNFLIEE